MEESAAPHPVAGWYMVAAIASLLFMVLGCIGVIMHVMTDPATLPLDQRALFEAEPKWLLGASAVGFLAGAVGALMLVRRRKAAERELLVSVVAMLIWGAGMFATPRFRDLLSTEQIAVLIAVIALDWAIFGLARHSGQRGWLR